MNRIIVGTSIILLLIGGWLVQVGFGQSPNASSTLSRAAPPSALASSEESSALESLYRDSELLQPGSATEATAPNRPARAQTLPIAWANAPDHPEAPNGLSLLRASQSAPGTFAADSSPLTLDRALNRSSIATGELALSPAQSANRGARTTRAGPSDSLAIGDNGSPLALRWDRGQWTPPMTSGGRSERLAFVGYPL